MSDPLVSNPFVLAGGFGGFVCNAAGKRRLLLRLGEHDCLLKLPRLLRRSLIGKLRPGEPIRVAGVEDRDPDTGLLRRVVTHVAADTGDSTGPVPPPAAAVTAVAVCKILVCAKKNCWRKGGRELWEALTHERAVLGLVGQIELRRVGCLDRCNRAPNIDCGGDEYARCSSQDARAILARAARISTPVHAGD